jgi:hypothetical protein
MIHETLHPLSKETLRYYAVILTFKRISCKQIVFMLSYYSQILQIAKFISLILHLNIADQLAVSILLLFTRHTWEIFFQLEMRLRQEFGNISRIEMRTRIFSNFFTVLIYNTSHFFIVLLYLPKWKMILNARWPCSRKYVCTEKVILWINFIILLQAFKRK